MILKSFELNKIDTLFKEKNFFLLYCENEGFKDASIEKYFEKKYPEKKFRYDQNEILENKDDFYDNIFSKSFFEDEKLIIISRVNEKIRETIEEVIEKEVENIKIVLNANILEKKSKLRTLFEKNKNTVCIPFYADSIQTLNGIISAFFRERKIPISQQIINLLSNRCRGDRKNLENELYKIENFILDKKKISLDDVMKLTNLAENYGVSELIDACLGKNQRKTINILNENNLSLDDCILIIRTFLYKAKRLLKIKEQTKTKNNINEIISSFKPPIFWKDKELIKQQIISWSHPNIENLVYEINEIELLIKKNPINSINILSDFIISKTIKSNN